MARRSKGTRARWLLFLAVLAQLWLPVLHAQHVHAPTTLIPADLHGELCLADRNNPVSDGPTRGAGDRGGMACECLTCKLLQAAAGPFAFGHALLVWETLADAPLYPRDVEGTPSYIRPPGRAPPLI